MRTLYQVYYKDKNRGFTDKEFREVCEKAAGVKLDEIFEIYVPTVKDIDYQKYLEYAGLSIDIEQDQINSVWLGISTRKEGDNLVINRTEWNSPAYNAGLSAQDVIKEINGEKASDELLNNVLSTGKPGDKISFIITHRGITNNVEIVTGRKLTRSFKIKPHVSASPEQADLLNKWLK
jgi:predicted metalloprotease with PDZ domain